MRRFLICNDGYHRCEKRTDDGWVDIICPVKEDIDFIVDELGIPQTFLDDLKDIDERPRVDRDGNWTLTIIRIPSDTVSDTMPYATVPLGIFISGKTYVTVCFFRTGIIEDFIDYSVRKSLNITRSADFILHLMFNSTYWFLTYLKQMNENVTGAEHALEKSVQNRDLISLMRLQKSLVVFNTSLRGNQILLEKLYHVYGTDFDHELYEDLDIEMKQADNTVEVYTHILDGTMEAFSSIISNNINQVMKRMTGITIILMVPTLVASFYGMNVKGLIFADLPLSFYIIMIIAAAFTLLTYLLLRYLKWF